MKKNILVLLIVSFHYVALAQSYNQQAVMVNTAATPSYSLSNTQQSIQSTSNTSNYNVVSPAVNYNQNAVTPVANSNVSNYQNYTTGRSKHLNMAPERTTTQKLSVIIENKPVFKQIMFSTGRSSSKDVIRISTEQPVLLSDTTLAVINNQVHPVINNQVQKDIYAYGNKVYTTIDTTDIGHPAEFKVRCIYGNYSRFEGLDWYSIHVASFKNLNYCKTVIRYIKHRYGLDVFIFDDFSPSMRYHLVMGKYRKYFVADNFLRKVRKELPGAFVVSWNRYWAMIIL